MGKPHKNAGRKGTKANTEQDKVAKQSQRLADKPTSEIDKLRVDKFVWQAGDITVK